MPQWAIAPRTAKGKSAVEAPVTFFCTPVRVNIGSCVVLWAPFSNSGFKTGPCQIAWSTFENARFAKFGRDLAVIWQRWFWNRSRWTERALGLSVLTMDCFFRPCLSSPLPLKDYILPTPECELTSTAGRKFVISSGFLLHHGLTSTVGVAIDPNACQRGTYTDWLVCMHNNRSSINRTIQTWYTYENKHSSLQYQRAPSPVVFSLWSRHYRHYTSLTWW